MNNNFIKHSNWFEQMAVTTETFKPSQESNEHNEINELLPLVEHTSGIGETPRAADLNLMIDALFGVD